MHACLFFFAQVRDSSQTLSVSTHPTSVEEVRGEESVSERISRSKLPGFGSLQHSVSSQAKIPDRLEDTATGTKILATAETEGQHTKYKHTDDKYVLRHYRTVIFVFFLMRVLFSFRSKSPKTTVTNNKRAFKPPKNAQLSTYHEFQLVYFFWDRSHRGHNIEQRG